MRRVVRPDSSNVELPVLPEARMDMRNEIRIPQYWRASDLPAKCSAAMDDGKLQRPRQHEVAEASLLGRYSSAKIALTYPLFSTFCGRSFVSGRTLRSVLANLALAASTVTVSKFEALDSLLT